MWGCLFLQSPAHPAAPELFQVGGGEGKAKEEDGDGDHEELEESH